MSTAPNLGTSIITLLCTAALAVGCGGGGSPADMTTTAGFAAVDAALVSKGCTLSACHGTGHAASISLTLTGTTATDYNTIVKTSGTLGPFYTAASPSTSNILLIPTNASGMHGNAATPPSSAWSSTDAEYKLMLAWLNAGVPQ